MKITFNRSADCDYYDRRLDETYPKSFRKWDTLIAEAVEPDGNMLNIALENGDTVMNVHRKSVDIR
jgi:hypothetical protein